MCSDKVETPNEFFEPARRIFQLFMNLSHFSQTCLISLFLRFSRENLFID